MEKSKNDNRNMKIKVIACRVFNPELDVLLRLSSDEIDIDYLPLRAHDRPDTLRADLQSRIDAHDAEAVYDVLVLAYGLCGNATAGLRSGSIPLFIPQAHDCSQILLGGRDSHNEKFADNPSRGWTSRGYLAEEGDAFRAGDPNTDWEMKDLVEKYGEDNARYVWETLHASDSSDDPFLYFLDVPETRNDEILKDARERAAERNKELVTVPATIELLSRLLSGRGGNEILAVAPGVEIRASWDEEVLMTLPTGQDGE